MTTHLNRVRQFFNHTDNYLDNSFGVKLRSYIAGWLIGPQQNKDILDIGCGNGMISLGLSHNNRTVLIDVSDTMLSLARENFMRFNPKALVTFYSDLSQIDDSRTFDYIIAFGLLAHLEDTELFFFRLKNLLKDNNSRILIQFSPYEKLTNKIRVKRAQKKSGYRINKINSKKLRKILESYGLVVEKELAYGLMFPGTGKLPDSLQYFLNNLTLRVPLLKFLYTEKVWWIKKS